jgi:hypothetical protein
LEKNKDWSGGVMEYWSVGKEQGLEWRSDGVLECWKRTRTGVMEYWF